MDIGIKLRAYVNIYEGNDMGCCGSCGGQDADKSKEQVKDESQAPAQDQESNKAQEQVAEKE